METSFYTKLSDTALAVADLCDYYNYGLIITRIMVPAPYRGLGHGSALLKQVIDAASKSNTTLFLEINPYGDMTYDDLEAWYKRYGFKEIAMGVYRRRP